MSDVHNRLAAEGKRALAAATSKPEKRAFQTALQFLADENTEAGFVHPSMCLTVLPHRATPADEVWERAGPCASLSVHPIRDEVTGEYLGVPFGPKARLILLFLQAEALKTGARIVELGRSMRQWLLAMGIADNGTNYRTVLAQARRIENSLIRFSFRSRDGTGRWQDSIIRGSFDPTAGDRRVELSEGFYRALRDHPVPVAESAIRLLADTCMPLDLYLWLAYRLHSLARPTIVSWQALHAQFGAATKELHHFKPRFVRDLRLATSVYPDAKVEVTTAGARLWPSPPPVLPRVGRSGLMIVPDHERRPQRLANLRTASAGPDLFEGIKD